MTEKSILITGCSSGIGYYCAHALKKRGWRVIATCRKQADIDRLISEGLECIQLDLDNTESITAAVQETLKRTDGRLDALYNNGAYSNPGAVEDLGTDYIRKIYETNFFGWYELTRQILPAMREQGHGRIVQCSSILAFAPVRFSTAYSSSKAAVESWSDVMRLELAGTGIYISIIQPGPILSDMLDNSSSNFVRTVDLRKSHFRNDYAAVASRFRSVAKKSVFKVGPEAVYLKLVHALESPRPHPRYRVTLPTRISAVLKRLLPTTAMDRLMQNQR